MWIAIVVGCGPRGADCEDLSIHVDDGVACGIDFVRCFVDDHRVQPRRATCDWSGSCGCIEGDEEVSTFEDAEVCALLADFEGSDPRRAEDRVLEACGWPGILR